MIFLKKAYGRRFSRTWFDQFSNWLEYSVKADQVFALCFYLFVDQFEGQGGSDALFFFLFYYSEGILDFSRDMVETKNIRGFLWYISYYS